MKTLTTYLYERVKKNEKFIQKQNDLIRLLEEKITFLENEIQSQNERQGKRGNMRVVAFHD